jgi:hypothetical protein
MADSQESASQNPDRSSVEEKLSQILQAVEATHAGGKAPWSAPWLSIEDAAMYSSTSPKSIRRLLSAGRLTPHRFTNGRILVSRAQIDSLIKSGANKRSPRGRKARVSNA